MTIDEAIWREVARAQSFRQRIESMETTDTTPLEECETEHRQLAEWLRELKKDKKILEGLRIYFQSLVVDAVFNQRPVMFEMRDATKEERESVKRYIADSVSTTGVDFGYLIGEVNADEEGSESE